MAGLRISLVSVQASPLAALSGGEAGGQSAHVAALATALAARGHQVTVHTRRDQAEQPEFVRIGPELTVHHVAAGPARSVRTEKLLPFMRGFGAELSRAWGRQRPDVVHAHYWMSGLAALLGARSHEVPVVHTYHSLGIAQDRLRGTTDRASEGRVAVETALGHQVDRIIATSHEEARDLQELGLPEDRVRVVPCGVDALRFCPGGPMAPRTVRPRLLMVGGLSRRRGIDTALRAMEWLPTAELLVVGGPAREQLELDPEARRLREIARQGGFAERFALLGRVAPARLPELFRSADCVLCPGWYEPFGMVALQAMACGTPVVAAGVGAHLDSLADPGVGRLVPPGNAAALAAAVAELLGSPALRRSRAVTARAHVLSHYTWPRVADTSARLYSELVPLAVPR